MSEFEMKKVEKPKPRKFVTKQEDAFINEIIKGATQAEAYKKAFDKPNYQDTSANTAGSRVFNKPHVKERYESLMTKIMDKSEDKIIVGQTEILESLHKIATGKMGDYVEWKNERYVDEASGRLKDRLVLKYKDSDKVDTSNIQEIYQGRNGEFKLKLYPRDAALINLAKHLGMFREQIDITEKKVFFDGESELKD